MSIDFLSVSENTARHPVARAIARRRVEAAVRDFATRLYLMAEGEDCSGDIYSAMHVLLVAVEVRMLRGEKSGDYILPLAGAIGALGELDRNDSRWKTYLAGPIDIGLQAAIRVFAEARPDEVNAGWLIVMRRKAEQQKEQACQQPA